MNTFVKQIKKTNSTFCQVAMKIKSRNTCEVLRTAAAIISTQKMLVNIVIIINGSNSIYLLLFF